MKGEELKRRRKQRGWTQQQLADRLGVSRVTVGLYEIDRHPIPQSKLNLINLTFNVPLTEQKNLTEAEAVAVLIIESFTSEFKILQDHLGKLSDRQQKTQQELSELKSLIKLNKKIDDEISNLEDS